MGVGTRRWALLASMSMVLTSCASGPVADPPPPSGAERLQVAGPPASSVDEEAADPVRVRVPVIGVDAPVGPLEVDATGVLQAPVGDHDTGWWRAGPEPGERGPAVVVGHVDSTVGPAVFFRLRELRAGDAILVDRADGSSATFVVSRIEVHPKGAFPTREVYRETPDAQLRLITCGGEFDRSERSYTDNVIAFATRTA